MTNASETMTKRESAERLLLLLGKIAKLGPEPEKIIPAWDEQGEPYVETPGEWGHEPRFWEGKHHDAEPNPAYEPYARERDLILAEITGIAAVILDHGWLDNRIAFAVTRRLGEFESWLPSCDPTRKLIRDAKAMKSDCEVEAIMMFRRLEGESPRDKISALSWLGEIEPIIANGEYMPCLSKEFCSAVIRYESLLAAYPGSPARIASQIKAYMVRTTLELIKSDSGTRTRSSYAEDVIRLADPGLLDESAAETIERYRSHFLVSSDKERAKRLLGKARRMVWSKRLREKGGNKYIAKVAAKALVWIAVLAGLVKGCACLCEYAK